MQKQWKLQGLLSKLFRFRFNSLLFKTVKLVVVIRGPIIRNLWRNFSRKRGHAFQDIFCKFSKTIVPWINVSPGLWSGHEVQVYLRAKTTIATRRQPNEPGTPP